MADTPPVTRPPSPTESLPAHTMLTNCYPSGANMAEFIDRLRTVLHNEWIRVRGGAPLDSTLEMRLANELLTAFSVGKVIPGYLRSANGDCEMHWEQFACFARWYSLLNEEQRADALDVFSSGIQTPWAEQGEYPWPPGPYPCAEGSLQSEAEWCAKYTDEGVCRNQWCCPPEVYSDPAYVGGSTKSNNKKWIALGLGALAAAGVVAFVISEASEPEYLAAE